jgi:cytochrome bd ubiquinol oxidase subunit I
MTDLLAARVQMAMSLGFHICFAVVGIAMPLLMVIAEWRWLRTGKQVYRELARRWARGTAIMFAVGAVSGTVLSFELGLLWPGFMEHAGPVIGMPFSLEGFAFFLEAIFLGLYLYGWNRLGRRTHLFCGVMVLISGALSAIFVIAANAWMNNPSGFTIDADGRFVDIDVWEAMWSTMWIGQAVHMLVAAFLAVGFAVAAIHARMLLREPGSVFHRKALVIALWVGAISAVVMPVTGDILGKQVAVAQPAKLAAMKGQWETQRGAPMLIGGWPDERTETTRYAIKIPKLFSFLATGDFDGEIKGLKEFPPEDRPPVAVVYVAFQIMIAIGVWLMGVAVLAGFLAWRRKALLDAPWFLKLLIVSGPLGIIGIQAGWTVTEVGRQPWIIYEVMRTAEAVTPMPHLQVPLVMFSLLYLVLAAVVIYLLSRHVFQSRGVDEALREAEEAG